MRAAASRSGGPQACPAGCARHILKPLFRILRCIPPSDCFTAPATGYRRESSGGLTSIGSSGNYHASSPRFSGSPYACYFSFGASSVQTLNGGSGSRAFGLSVRCVQASAPKLLFVAFSRDAAVAILLFISKNDKYFLIFKICVYICRDDTSQCGRMFSSRRVVSRLVRRRFAGRRPKMSGGCCPDETQ